MTRLPFLAASASLAALAAMPACVIAADYLSIEGAQQALFGQADHFDEVVPALSAPQKQAVTGLAGPQPSHRSLRVWKAMRAGELIGHVFVDEVLGRQDMITYAVAIDRAGRMSEVEVLSYR